MRIGLVRQGKNITCIKEYTDIKDSGEIAHFLAEIKIIEKDLIELWEEYHNENT